MGRGVGQVVTLHAPLDTETLPVMTNANFCCDEYARPRETTETVILSPSFESSETFSTASDTGEPLAVRIYVSFDFEKHDPPLLILSSCPA